jgi:hypothetical protein
MRVQETSGIPVSGMWANARGRPGYLHAIYTTWNVCTSVWRMEGIISVLLKTGVLY